MGKKRFKKAIGVQRGEKSENQVNSLLVLNQIPLVVVSWRLPSIGAVLENNPFFFAFFRKSVWFSCNIEHLSALDAPLSDSGK